MPGEKSLALQQYYGHTGNHFWKIMFRLFDRPFTSDYGVRTALLAEKGIALWDVLRYCEREGSADSRIKKEVANDFAAFYRQHPQIGPVFFASQMAQAYYIRHVGLGLGRDYFLLPSPSGANSWKSLDEKVAEWELIRRYL